MLIPVSIWYPENQDTKDRDNIQSMLYPELRYSSPQSEQGKIYKLRMNELHQLLDEAQEQFLKYRSAAHELLLD